MKLWHRCCGTLQAWLNRLPVVWKLDRVGGEMYRTGTAFVRMKREGRFVMEGPLRGCLAGAAWKWGGGCFSTIIIFIIVYLLLGHVKC